MREAGRRVRRAVGVLREAERLAEHVDRPRVRLLQERQAAQQRALAGARGADHAGRGAGGDLEVDLLQDLRRAEGFAEAFDGDGGGHATAYRCKPPLRHSAERGGDFDQPPIAEREQEQRLDEGVELGAEGADGQRQLRHGDDGQDRGVLQQADGEVDAGRQHQHRHFGQQDAAHDLPAREPHAFGRLDMAARHRLEAGAKHFAEIGAAVDRQRQQSRGQRVERQAGVGAAEIEQEQLHQERRAAEQFDVGEQRPR